MATVAQWFEDLHRSLEVQYKDLKSRADRGLDPSDIPRWNLVKHLRARYDKLVGSQSTGGKGLFISCHYNGNQLDIVKSEAESKGFSVVTGKDLLPYDTINHGLVNKINSCTHFLGVWTRDGAQVLGRQYWPSPWLLWEFRVAQAFGLTWRLLISDKIDGAAWNKIASHCPQAIFSELDFQTRLAQILDVLSALPVGSFPFIDTAG